MSTALAIRNDPQRRVEWTPAAHQMIAEALGADKVIYGTVTTAIGRRGVGDIALEKLRGLPSTSKPSGLINDVGAMKLAPWRPRASGWPRRRRRT